MRCHKGHKPIGAKPKIVVVINVTPDSFSDGGQFFDTSKAFAHADQALSEGADIVEFGAESSRPGATGIDVETERQRLLPVLERATGKFKSQQICIDTRKPAIMLEAAEAGVGYINNIEGLADDETLGALSKHTGLSYIAMHMHRNPSDMQSFPMDSNADCQRVIMEMRRYIRKLRGIGFSSERVFVDPGIGFGKTDLINLQLLNELACFADEAQLRVGISRKSLIGRLFDVSEARERDPVSKALELGLMMSGVRLIRTHSIGKLPLMRDLLFGGDCR